VNKPTSPLAQGMRDLAQALNRLVHSQDQPDTMREVTSWEHRSPNYGEYIVAHLSCGHERTFNGDRPVGKGKVRCWECDKLRDAQ
jgi:hypothetical protein